MNSRAWMGRAIRLLLAGLVSLAFPGCGRIDKACELFPRGPVKALCFRTDELPRDYRLLTDQALLDELQLRRNPDYVRRPSDLELVARAGGMASFLALYGPASNDVRLVLNGVYFDRPERVEAFAAMQQEKQRQVIAFRRKTTDGFWLLLAARNPAHTYEDEEAADLRAGIDHFARRLRLEPVFDRLDNGHAP